MYLSTSKGSSYSILHPQNSINMDMGYLLFLRKKREKRKEEEKNPCSLAKECKIRSSNK